MFKSKRWARASGVMIVAALLVTGCGKKAMPRPEPVVPVVPEAPPPPPPLPSAPVAERVTERTLSEDELFAQKSLADLNADTPLSHAFFDLDSSTIRSQELPSMQRNAAWLTRWPTTRITVEGHGDSRGTSEYNLALGDRRASAVRDYLSSLGVDAARIALVSKGEEQPFCHDEHEACWQSNRRGHFLITAK